MKRMFGRFAWAVAALGAALAMAAGAFDEILAGWAGQIDGGEAGAANLPFRLVGQRLADGRLLMDIRQNSGSHRWLAESTDGGQTWAKVASYTNVYGLSTDFRIPGRVYAASSTGPEA